MNNNYARVTTRTKKCWESAVGDDVILASDDTTIADYPGRECAREISIGVIDDTDATLVVELFDEKSKAITTHTFDRAEILNSGGVVEGQFSKIIATGSTCYNLVARY